MLCSGRTRQLFRQPYNTFVVYDLRPDFAVLANRNVYRTVGDRLVIDPWLSMRVILRSAQCRISLPRELKRIAKLVAGHFPHVRALHVRSQRLEIMVSDDTVAHDVAAFIREETINEPLILVDEDRAIIEAGISNLHKVLAVSEVQRALSIAPRETLVIGAGTHDGSLMNESVGHFAGCPANATPRTLRHVSRTQGHIARTACLAGAAECIQAHLTGEILSSPPSGSFDAQPSLSTLKERVHQHGVSDRSRVLEVGVLFVAGAISLLVLASFGLLPFSGVIMKPFSWAMGALGDVFTR